MPSIDVDLKIPNSPQNLRRLFAQIIRPEGYFRTLLIQSRGTVQANYSKKCAKSSSHKFLDCRTIPGFYRGAYTEYVWQSHGARCDYYTQVLICLWWVGWSSVRMVRMLSRLGVCAVEVQP